MKNPLYDLIYEITVIKDKSSPCHICLVRPACSSIKNHLESLLMIGEFCQDMRFTYDDLVDIIQDENKLSDIYDMVDNWCDDFFNYLAGSIVAYNYKLVNFFDKHMELKL